MDRSAFAGDTVLIGASPAMATLRAEIDTAARTHAKVMVLGETGVGKEVVARMIHQRSGRGGSSFVAVNCSGVPETLLESELFGHARGSFTGAYRDKAGLIRQAHRGTLFLDELGEMSLRMQAVLLRFTETGEIQQVGADTPVARADVRLITATNRDIRSQIAAGAFREDLYYRLNVIQIGIPPLRERGDDILLLLEHYLERSADAHALAVPMLTAAASKLLLTYAWPGNVRELRNIAERVVLQNKRAVTPDDLPVEIRGTTQSPKLVSSRPSDVTAFPAPAAARPAPAAVTHFWERMQAGEDFWAVVHRAFKARELTRTELASLVDRGLRETRGSYRALLKVFNLPESDYKRLHAFLYQQQCNLPVGPYRQLRAVRPRPTYHVA